MVSGKIKMRNGMKLLALCFLTTTAPAATLIWNPTLSSTGVVDGAGAWDGTTTNWSDGAANTNWSDATPDSAVFGATNGTAGTVTNIGARTVGGITFNAASSETYTISGGTLLLSGDATITANTNATIGSVLSGSASLTKAGNGTLTLTATNTYTGGTTVNGGILSLETGGGAGIIRGSLTINSGGTVAAGGGWSLGYISGTCVNRIAINGGVLQFGAVGGGASATNITMTGGAITGAAFDWFNGINSTPSITTVGSTTTATISGGINLRLGASGTLTFNVVQGTAPEGVDLLVSGPIANGALAPVGGNVIKSGAGTMVLSGTNTYTGWTSIAGGGTLVIGGVGKLGNGSYANNIYIDGVFCYNSSASQTLSGQIYHTGAVAKAGDGMLTLSSALNSWSGGTTISGGTLKMSGAGVLGATTGILTVASGTLDLNGTSQTVGLFSGAGVVGNSSAISCTLTVGSGASGSADFSGVVTDSLGTLSLAKRGAGTLTLSGANTYHGMTSINGGTLRLGASGTLNSQNNLTMSGGVLDGGTVVNELGTLSVTSNATCTIRIGVGGALSFGDSSTISWNGRVNIEGAMGARSLRFGATRDGLTRAQLQGMNFNTQQVFLDDAGYVATMQGAMLMVR
jgi:fibronectin-binding autotransporter adhesin